MTIIILKENTSKAFGFKVPTLGKLKIRFGMELHFFAGGGVGESQECCVEF